MLDVVVFRHAIYHTKLKVLFLVVPAMLSITTFKYNVPVLLLICVTMCNIKTPGQNQLVTVCYYYNILYSHSWTHHTTGWSGPKQDPHGARGNSSRPKTELLSPSSKAQRQEQRPTGSSASMEILHFDPSQKDHECCVLKRLCLRITRMF